MPSSGKEKAATGLEQLIASAAMPPAHGRGVTAREQIMLVAASDAGRKEKITEEATRETAPRAGETSAPAAKAPLASFWSFGGDPPERTRSGGVDGGGFRW